MAVQVGDIIVQGERGAHVLVVESIADYLIQELKSVRSVPVSNFKIALSELGVRPPVRKDVSPALPPPSIYLTWCNGWGAGE